MYKTIIINLNFDQSEFYGNNNYVLGFEKEYILDTSKLYSGILWCMLKPGQFPSGGFSINFNEKYKLFYSRDVTYDNSTWSGSHKSEVLQIGQRTDISKNGVFLPVASGLSTKLVCYNNDTQLTGFIGVAQSEPTLEVAQVGIPPANVEFYPLCYPVSSPVIPQSQFEIQLSGVYKITWYGQIDENRDIGIIVGAHQEINLNNYNTAVLSMIDTLTWSEPIYSDSTVNLIQKSY